MEPVTPAVLVDRPLLERTVAAMAQRALHIVSDGAIAERWGVAARGRA
jgi:hypothetical protein